MCQDKNGSSLVRAAFYCRSPPFRHLFRDTVASCILEHKVPITTISTVLGHACNESTDNLSTSEEQLKQCIPSLEGFEIIRGKNLEHISYCDLTKENVNCFLQWLHYTIVSNLGATIVIKDIRKAAGFSDTTRLSPIRKLNIPDFKRRSMSFRF